MSDECISGDAIDTISIAKEESRKYHKGVREIRQKLVEAKLVETWSNNWQYQDGLRDALKALGAEVEEPNERI
jgi:hypothetical protein